MLVFMENPSSKLQVLLFLPSNYLKAFCMPIDWFTMSACVMYILLYPIVNAGGNNFIRMLFPRKVLEFYFIFFQFMLVLYHT